MNIRGIPAILIEKFWPLAEPYIKRALDRSHGEWEPEDIRNFCIGMDMQLWLVSDGDKIIAAITTEIVNYPRRRHLRIVTLAGSRTNEWLNDAAKIVFDWAKEIGCQGIEAQVRKGFVAQLQKDGFKSSHCVIYKDI